MLALAPFQELFLNTLRFKETPSALADNVRGAGDLSPTEALDVYRQMYWFRLVDAHFALFPALAVWLGKAKFVRLVTSCLTQSPSHTPVLERLARPFADRSREVLEPECVSSDLCAIEAAVIDSLLAPDPEGELLAPLHTQRPGFEHFRMRVVPSLSVIQASRKAIEHFESSAKLEPTDEGLSTGGGGDTAFERERAHYVLVRPRLHVHHLLVSPLETELLSRAKEGVSVGDVLATLEEERGDVKGVFERLVTFMNLGLFVMEAS
ncbi:MAG: putative DNA-binding domain-containing protein [Polyangiaceae bacterium]